MAERRETFRELLSREDRRHGFSALWIAFVVVLGGGSSALLTPAVSGHGIDATLLIPGIVLGVGCLFALYLAAAALFELWPHKPSRYRPPLPEHVDRLRKVARTLLDDLGGTRLRYSDGTHEGPTLTAIFRHHVGPSLAGMLDDFEAAGPKFQAARKALRQCIEGEVQALNGGWKVDEVIRAASGYVDIVAERPGKPDPQLSIERQTFPINPPGSVVNTILWKVHVALGNVPNWMVWDSVDADFPMVEPLQAAADRILTSSEYLQMKQARDLVASARQAAFSELEGILGRDDFPGQCTELCWQRENR